MPEPLAQALIDGLRESGSDVYADPDTVPSLAGRGFVVTGAAAGQGRAVARLLARSGCHLALCDIQTDETLLQELSECAESKTTIFFDIVDISDEAAVDAFVTKAAKQLPVVAGLAHCAGIGGARGKVGEMTTEFWDKTIGVNLRGSFFVSRAVLNIFLSYPSTSIPKGGFAIVLIGSIFGEMCMPGSTAYGTSKAGVHFLSRSMAVEYAAQGIRSNAIAPGRIATSMLNKWGDASLRNNTMIPMNRIAHASEVASVVAYLLSPASSYVTGTVQHVDGGWLPLCAQY